MLNLFIVSRAFLSPKAFMSKISGFSNYKLNVKKLKLPIWALPIRKSFAFSLVEMLMALLVASLLLAALAPVMTKRMNEADIKVMSQAADYDKNTVFSVFTTDTNFNIPIDANQVRITMMGGGGAGGDAYYENKTFTSSQSWTVPQNVTKLRVFMVGAGGGGASGGGSIKTSYADIPALNGADGSITEAGAYVFADKITPPSNYKAPEFPSTCKNTGVINQWTMVSDSDTKIAPNTVFKKVGGNGKTNVTLTKVTACGAGGGRGYNSMPGGTGSYVENQALNTTTAASNIYLAVGEGGKSGSKTSGSINNNYGGAGAVVPGGAGGNSFLGGGNANSGGNASGSESVSTIRGGNGGSSSASYNYNNGGAGGKSAGGGKYIGTGGGGGGGGATTILTGAANTSGKIIFQVGGGGGSGTQGSGCEGNGYSAGGGGGAGGGAYGGAGGSGAIGGGPNAGFGNITGGGYSGAGGGSWNQGSGGIGATGGTYGTPGTGGRYGGGNGVGGKGSANGTEGNSYSVIGGGGTGGGGGGGGYGGSNGCGWAQGGGGGCGLGGEASRIFNDSNCVSGDPARPGAIKVWYNVPAVSNGLKCDYYVQANSGGGGGAGQIWIGEIDVTPGQVINMNIGVGGNKTTQDVYNVNGNDGTATSITVGGNVYSVSGGKGGKYENDDTYIQNSGGYGGGIKTTNFSSSARYNNWTNIDFGTGGGNGSQGNIVSNGAGGGNGGISYDLKGSVLQGGVGGGVHSDGMDAASNSYGAGGGGGGGVTVLGSGSGRGGKGANGYIYIEWGGSNGGGGTVGEFTQMMVSNLEGDTSKRVMKIRIGRGGGVLKTQNDEDSDLFEESTIGENGNGGTTSISVISGGKTIRGTAKGGIKGNNGTMDTGVHAEKKPLPNGYSNLYKEYVQSNMNIVMGQEGSSDYGGMGGYLACLLKTKDKDGNIACAASAKANDSTNNSAGPIRPGCGGSSILSPLYEEICNITNTGVSASGNNGVFGGGGGGGAVLNNTGGNGGKGGNGFVILEYKSTTLD